MRQAPEERREELARKWLEGTATPEEKQELDNWYNQAGEGSAEVELSTSDSSAETFRDRVFRRINAQKVPATPIRRMTRTWWAAAAILVLLAAGAVYRYQSSRPQPAPLAQTLADTDITPGRNGAILTLADGSRLVLDSMPNGVIATQKGAQVLLQNGQLAYHTNNDATGATVYNTITTPRGRQFQLTLPDGSKVWLNAASSLKYPTTFTGKQRQVEVTGEAYFEVAANAAMPFSVHAGQETEIVVLGTHFNVNAYDNENNISTTLLEGAVRVNGTLIKPGQQAQLSHHNTPKQPGIKVLPADTEKVMAWKNGWFNFEGVSFEEAMKQLERWYDIEVVYEKGVPDIQFVGEISKDVTLTGLLKLLEDAQVHFKIAPGRRLVVTPE